MIAAVHHVLDSSISTDIRTIPNKYGITNTNIGIVIPFGHPSISPATP
jgi:hypothetical protein